MAARKKDSDDELYDEKYDDMTEEQFLEVLEEEQQPLPPRARKKKRRKRRGVTIMASLLAIMLVFQAGAYLFDTFRMDAIDFLKTSYTLSQDEQVQSWKEAVVTVQGEGRFGCTKGTGFFIEESGLLLTNHHVIEDLRVIGIHTEEGEILEGEVVKSDEEKDLALVQTNPSENVAALPLQTENAHTGEHIYVIGNPLSFTKIANEGRVLDEAITNTSALGISAPIYRGNSGSPVIGEDGRVAGVVYAKKTIQHPEQESVGLAVPIDDVHQFLKP
ncbi:Trypsin-like peptidase domain-containing protein [Alteribacillus persepolensis]|uniref:Trypsin-like peptidase domain-containing protein n=1 Tax=Alteribacillus persepolensis TaxID=568899 RepID=A0A1G7Z7E7_9BACI|nr:serine protease [Alteribacillus persepolensis]SDH04537.1 Trypsin-like peptidase domain-containing protein [Alteribacillus persepolensis]